MSVKADFIFPFVRVVCEDAMPGRICLFAGCPDPRVDWGISFYMLRKEKTSNCYSLTAPQCGQTPFARILRPHCPQR